MSLRTNSFYFQAAIFSLIIATNLIVRAADAPAAATPAASAPEVPMDPAMAESVAKHAPLPNPAADGRILTANIGKDVAPRSNRVTNHVSNYDERVAGNFTLPDVLTLSNGQPVKDADTWWKLRRPEILKVYEEEVYGKVPDSAPKITWEVTSTDPKTLSGAAVMKHVVGHVGDKTNPNAFDFAFDMYTPANAKGPVPFFFALMFGSSVDNPGTPIADIIARGYGYGSVLYPTIEPEAAAARRRTPGVIEAAFKPGQTEVAADEWGCISAWAWTLSRIVDYLETDKDVDAKRVAIVGHSRLGKTVLWAGAQDPRIAMILSSQSGEMGASLSRRDYGETIDDIATSLGYHFDANFQKYIGHWNDLPVDAHMLIALNAPRPVFVTGANYDTWSDPHGELLGEVFAEPVYKLLGAPGLNLDKSQMATDPRQIPMPPLDTPIMNGKLGYLYHNGGHFITPLDWKTFLDFADKNLKPAPAAQK